MSEKLGVALTRIICPICGKDVENPLILNTKLIEEEASKVKELHNKIKSSFLYFY